MSPVRRKPCIVRECRGYSTDGGPRCSLHERTRQQARNAGRVAYNDPVYRLTRAYLLANPGARCVRCGGREDLTVDHILPVVLGGTNELSNLQIMCRKCNSSKGPRREQR